MGPGPGSNFELLWCKIASFDLAEDQDTGLSRCVTVEVRSRR